MATVNGGTQAQIHTRSMDLNFHKCASFKREVDGKYAKGQSYRLKRVKIGEGWIYNPAVLDVQCYTCNYWKNNKEQLIRRLEKMHQTHQANLE